MCVNFFGPSYPLSGASLSSFAMWGTAFLFEWVSPGHNYFICVGPRFVVIWIVYILRWTCRLMSLLELESLELKSSLLSLVSYKLLELLSHPELETGPQLADPWSRGKARQDYAKQF